ncbi:MAG: hypothetical protein V1929_11820 [bacterium]
MNPVRLATLVLLCAAHTALAASQDSVQAIRVDPAHGAVYVCGNTTGNLGGDSKGATDTWVAKLNALGMVQWIRTYGTVGDDTAQGLAFDGTGNIYVNGNTVGTPDLGGTNAYVVNSWLNKYDNNGNLIYGLSVKTKGTTEGTDVDADRDGNVYLCGFTAVSLTNFGSTAVNQGELDAWFGKLDTNGFRSWLTQIGTPGNDVATAVSAGPRGTLFVTGFTDGSLGGTAQGARDYWLAQYDANGNQLWIRQGGTVQEDVSTELDTDAMGNPVIGGYTQGSLAARKSGQNLDAWAARYLKNGRRVWARQLDSQHEDTVSGLAASRTMVDLTGAAAINQGPQTPWLAQFSIRGKLNSAKFFDTSKEQDIVGIDNDNAGSSYLAINVNSAAGSGSADGDVSIVKLDANEKLVWARRIAGTASTIVQHGSLPEPDVTYVVRPQDTDPQITTWLDEHIIFRSNAPSRNGQLIVFFPGSYATPRAYLSLLKAYSAAGYYVIGLQYPNSFDVLGLCDEMSVANPSCQEQVRSEILTGADDSPFVDVSFNNSIVNRLTRLLTYLDQQHPGDGWAQWLDPATGQPDWSRMILSGHSQGSGHACYISKLFTVARVVMLSGPEDQQTSGVPSPWITAPNGATPADRYYGFGHVSDTFYSRFSIAWQALGMGHYGDAVNVDNSSRPFNGTHQLLTAAPPSDGTITGLKAHNSPAANISTPTLPDSTPIYGAHAVWQYLVTTP